MKEIDEVNYHLSNFHRDLMESNTPDIADTYRELHARLKADEQAVYDRQCEIRDFIKAHKLKAKKKPEQIERERLRKLGLPVATEPEQMTFPFPRQPNHKILALISSLRPAK